MPPALRLVELRRVRLPLVEPMATAHATVSAKDTVLVRVVAADGAEGWGECGALPSPTYTGEWAGGAWEVLRRFLVPAALAGQDSDVVGQPMATAALETAVLDARLRSEGRSLADHLGAVRTRVECGVAVGLDAPPDAVGRHLAAGYRRVKVKIAPGRDARPLEALRAAFGPAARLWADANRSYAGTDAARLLGPVDRIGLEVLEQPLAADALLDHAALARALATPVGLDESVTSPAVAADAVALGAARVLCVKPAVCGGVAPAARILVAAAEAGINAYVGGMYDTGIARAAALALAAMPGATLPGDLSPTSRWFRTELLAGAPADLVDGCLVVPAGPGLGVEVDAAAVAAVTDTLETMRA